MSAYLHPLACPFQTVHPETAGTYLPLLPAQRAIQYRLDTEDLLARGRRVRGAQLRGDGYLEPLRHHAYATYRSRRDTRHDHA